MAKILIVDDSNMSRKLMRKILQTEGHEVIEAADGLTALETYLLEKPDLVLMDLLMPDMQGTEVLVKLRQLDDKAQVIVASADLQDLTRASVEAAGAVGYITKPFVASNVLKVVNSVLQGIKKIV